MIIFKGQYCFANISAMKAPILMKFETYIHKIFETYIDKIFEKTRARMSTPRVRACVHGSLQKII